MSFRTSGLALAAVVVALLAGCSLLSPGYDQRNAELTAALKQAEVARAVAEGNAEAAATAAAASVKAATDAAAGDTAAQAAAAAKATADLQAMVVAISALADGLKAEAEANARVVQNDAQSAAEAARNAGGLTTGEGVTGALAIAGTLLAAWAKAKADKVTAGPSRAQSEVDDLWERHAALEAKVAQMQGRNEVVPGVVGLKSDVAA